MRSKIGVGTGVAGLAGVVTSTMALVEAPLLPSPVDAIVKVVFGAALLGVFLAVNRLYTSRATTRLRWLCLALVIFGALSVIALHSRFVVEAAAVPGAESVTVAAGESRLTGWNLTEEGKRYKSEFVDETGVEPSPGDLVAQYGPEVLYGGQYYFLVASYSLALFTVLASLLTLLATLRWDYSQMPAVGGTNRGGAQGGA